MVPHLRCGCFRRGAARAVARHRPAHGAARGRQASLMRTSRTQPTHSNGSSPGRLSQSGLSQGGPPKSAAVLAVAGMVLAVAATGCGSKGERAAGAEGDVLRIGASLSLSGKLAREGLLTKEGYELCRQGVNAKGGVPVGGRKMKLEIQYQDDTSKPDTAAQLVDQFNDKGVKLILGPYGSDTTSAAAAVIERNGQVMADSSGADDKIFQKGYRRTFAVLSPAKSYAASMVKAVTELAAPKPKTIAFLSADDGFSKTVTEGGIAEARRGGLTVVAEEYFANGTSDVSAALTKVKALKPDVIIGSVHLVEGVAVIR